MAYMEESMTFRPTRSGIHPDVYGSELQAPLARVSHMQLNAEEGDQYA
jgi:hypothetical protein